MKRLRRWLLAMQVLVLPCAVVFSTGCATYRTHSLRASDRFARVPAAGVKTLYVHAYSSAARMYNEDSFRAAGAMQTPDQTIMEALEKGVPGVNVVPLYRDDMTQHKKTADGSGTMAVYSGKVVPAKVLERMGPNDAVLTLSARGVWQQPALTIVNAVLSGLTFTLLPTSRRDTMTIHATAYDKQGAKIWSGDYSDGVHTLIWALLLTESFGSDSLFRGPDKFAEIYRELAGKAANDFVHPRNAGASR